MQNELNNSSTGASDDLYAFFFKTMLILGVLLGFYYGWFLDSSWYTKLLAFIVETTSTLLDAIGFEHVVAFDRRAGFAEIHSEVGGGIVWGGLIVINKSCDAFLEMSIMLAVLLAWPGSAGKKLLFAVFGIALVVALNFLRIVALALIDFYWPIYFPMANQWILPALMIFAVLLYFLIWVRVADNSQGTDKLAASN